MKKIDIKFDKETAVKFGKASLEVGKNIIIEGTKVVVLKSVTNKLGEMLDGVSDKLTSDAPKKPRKSLFGRKDKEEVVITETVEVTVVKTEDKTE